MDAVESFSNLCSNALGFTYLEIQMITVNDFATRTDEDHKAGLALSAAGDTTYSIAVHREVDAMMGPFHPIGRGKTSYLDDPQKEAESFMSEEHPEVPLFICRLAVKDGQIVYVGTWDEGTHYHQPEIMENYNVS